MGDSGEFSTEGWTVIAPGKYHVILRVGNDWDEWLTAGKDHYRNAGLWYRIEEPETSQATYRLQLNLPAWVSLMRNEKCIRASAFEAAGESYIQLAFAAADFAGLELGPVTARIWIDARTLLIAKAVITYRDGTKEAQLEQMFTTHNDRVSVWAPTVNMGKDGGVISNKVQIFPRWGIFVMRAFEQRSTIVPSEWSPVEESSAGSVGEAEDKLVPHHCQKCGAPVGEGTSVCFECR